MSLIARSEQGEDQYVKRVNGFCYDCRPTIMRPLSWYCERHLVAGFANTRAARRNCNCDFVTVQISAGSSDVLDSGTVNIAGELCGTHSAQRHSHEDFGPCPENKNLLMAQHTLQSDDMLARSRVSTLVGHTFA